MTAARFNYARMRQNTTPVRQESAPKHLITLWLMKIDADAGYEKLNGLILSMPNGEWNVELVIFKSSSCCLASNMNFDIFCLTISTQLRSTGFWSSAVSSSEQTK